MINIDKNTIEAYSKYFSDFFGKYVDDVKNEDVNKNIFNDKD